ncbi:TadE/TadG family type IV pilus assembly protein [Promicromonospora vindobonensis]|uniref:TadE/TadG family type IV pilus assembly protein n=1 Tax=Promicromonospora vindobonensis TaxID=195748 RepID=A0ABW5W2F4_9MICO
MTSGGPERGSAAAEFLLVSVLVLALLLGVVQVALAVHVRSLATDAAAEGARVAARVDRGPADGVARTRALLADALTADYARDVTAGRTTLDGAAVTEVTVRAPLPVVGLLGPGGTLTVRGHALEEAP